MITQEKTPNDAVLKVNNLNKSCQEKLETKGTKAVPKIGAKAVHPSELVQYRFNSMYIWHEDNAKFLLRLLAAIKRQERHPSAVECRSCARH